MDLSLQRFWHSWLEWKFIEDRKIASKECVNDKSESVHNKKEVPLVAVWRTDGVSGKGLVGRLQTRLGETHKIVMMERGTSRKHQASSGEAAWSTTCTESVVLHTIDCSTGWKCTLQMDLSFLARMENPMPEGSALGKRSGHRGPLVSPRLCLFLWCASSHL